MWQEKTENREKPGGGVYEKVWGGDLGQKDSLRASGVGCGVGRGRCWG